MRILVLSDSHSAISFMRFCVDRVKPELILHLGDYVSDGLALAEEYPQIRFLQVPGNCDMYRIERDMPEIMTPVIDGVKLYMTHGHRHGVKTYTGKLIRDARAAGAKVALYGHTHIADCHQEEDGLWVLNPGSCGYYGGSAGLLEVDCGKVLNCCILQERDLR